MKPGGQGGTQRPTRLASRCVTKRSCRVLAFSPVILALGCASAPGAPAQAARGEIVADRDTGLDPQAVIPRTRETEGTHRAGTAKSHTAQQAARSPSGDLWARVRKGLGFPRIRSPRIRREAQRLGRDSTHLNRVAARARPYLHYIVEETSRRGLPTEIALLPVIESAYQPFAQSPTGASGLWQFMAATGRQYGLKQNWWYDGRRDVFDSTEAALNYLEALNQRFEGDWLLAIAAYNSGEGTVRNAIRHNQHRGKQTDFWSLELPAETRRHVPRLLAIAEIIAQPDHYDLVLEPIPDAPFFTAVEVEGQIDLARAAGLAGIPVEEIYTLNPGFSQWATDPSGPHRLLVPTRNATQLRAKLQELSGEELVHWSRYVIEEGDTLGHIAVRHQVTPRILQEINRLRSTTIRTGQSLLVPRVRRGQRELSVSARAGESPVARANLGRDLTHVVRSGDTLWDIANLHQVSVGELARWNGLQPTAILHPGNQLTLSQPRKHTRTTKVARKNVRRVRYTIQPGDSLWEISRRFNVSVDSLQTWNEIREGGRLYPGQELDIYLSPVPPVAI